LTVSALGNTSITYHVDVRSGSTPVASGEMVAVFTDRVSGEKRAWPDPLRRALSPTSDQDG